MHNHRREVKMRIRMALIGGVVFALGACAPPLQRSTKHQVTEARRPAAAHDERFHHAELLYGPGRWEQAAGACTRVVGMAPGAKHLQDAASAAVAAERRAAEALQRRGEFQKCGGRYAAAARAYPDSPAWPELLYNAAICYEAAGLVERAISARKTLLQAKPKHVLSQRAMYQIGNNYKSLARYSLAADYYELFTTRYPGERWSHEVLREAIVFRLGLGQYEKALQNSRMFIKNYGPRRKYAYYSASVSYTMGAIYERRGQWRAMVDHYKKFLAKWGRYGGPALQVRAHVKIGETLWRRSCPAATLGGLCVKQQRPRSARRRARRGRQRKTAGGERRGPCGLPAGRRLKLLRRRRAQAAEAQRHFEMAVAVYRAAVAGGKWGRHSWRGDHELGEYAAASALFHQAEGLLERSLSIAAPEQRVVGMFAAASRAYEAVTAPKVAQWSIAATARRGQLLQFLADRLPRGADCEETATRVGLLQARAEQRLSTCARVSADLQCFNRWTRLCHHELRRMNPAKYPPDLEIYSPPGFSGLGPFRVRLINNRPDG
jgi:outer membrane protein assembly factor BamD (BamD/ComL family)